MFARVDKLLIPVVALAMAVTVGFLLGRNNARSEVAWLKDEVNRYANEAIIQSAEQLERQKRLAELSETIGAYEFELANGTAVACAADPAYTSRLRQILQTPGAAPAVGGPEGISSFP